MLYELLCTVSMTEYLLIVPELCCRPFQVKFVLIKLKKGDENIKDIFLSEYLHQCTTHLHSFITDGIWTGKLKKNDKYCT